MRIMRNFIARSTDATGPLSAALALRISRIKVHVEDLFQGVRALGRKCALVQVGLLDGQQHALRVSLGETFGQHAFQAGIVLNQADQGQTLFFNGRAPTPRTKIRLVFPFEQMAQLCLAR